MEVVIFGSRFKKASVEQKRIVRLVVEEIVASLEDDTYVVTGGAIGVDTWAEMARRARGLPGTVMHAKWNEYGVYNPKAGFERNVRMAVRKPDKAIGVWDGKSGGSKQMFSVCKRRGIRVQEVIV